MPSPGTVVTLPANSKVLLSGCMISTTATYTQIIVPAGSEVRGGGGACWQRCRAGRHPAALRDRGRRLEPRRHCSTTARTRRNTHIPSIL